MKAAGCSWGNLLRAFHTMPIMGAETMILTPPVVREASSVMVNEHLSPSAGPREMQIEQKSVEFTSENPEEVIAFMGFNVNTSISLWICRALSLTCCATMPACSWRGWKDEPAQFGVISVRLQSQSQQKKAVHYVRTMERDRRRAELAGLRRLDADGSAAFVVRMGAEYDVCIFADLNKNQVPDPNEPAATAGGLIPTPPSAAPMPVTLAFGYDGGVSSSGNGRPPASHPVQAAPGPAVPSAALPYMNQMPLWMREQMAR